MTDPGPPKRGKLYVEGLDDFHTIGHLVQIHGFDLDVAGRGPEFQQAIGAEEVLKPALLKAAFAAHYTRIGLVLDADFPPRDRWAQTRGLLKHVQLDLPESPRAEGTILDAPDGRSVGVWLMPDNVKRGTLEHLVDTLIPPGDPTRALAESATREAQTLGAPLRPDDAIKGTVHAWLAWREDPGCPFGVAIKKRYLNHPSKEADAFVKWFKQLFE